MFKIIAYIINEWIACPDCANKGCFIPSITVYSNDATNINGANCFCCNAKFDSYSGVFTNE